MSEYKVGQRIILLDVDTIRHENTGKSGIITSICEGIVYVEYDDGNCGKSNNPSRYYKIIEEKTSIMTSIKEFVKNSLLNADEKALREVGFKDSCGNFTSEARDLAINLLCEESESKMVEIAKAMIAEKKAK